MNGSDSVARRLPNGAGVAALLAAGLGSLALTVLALVADHSPVFKKRMIFYTPTGPLSGVTTLAMAVWLLSWVVLDRAWKKRELSRGLVRASLVMVAVSFLLLFPPIGDLL